MDGKAIARATSAAVTLGLAVAITAGGSASATTPVDQALASLDQQAGSDQALKTGVAALKKSAKRVKTAGTYAPFLYASPTSGCGNNLGPFTLTAASGMSDAGPGNLRFQAAPAYSGVPTSSGLTIAWVNLNTGASGLTPIDDTTEYHLPSLSKSVQTGQGTVAAAMWGSVNYTDAICTVAPTVGSFNVDVQPNQPA